MNRRNFVNATLASALVLQETRADAQSPAPQTQNQVDAFELDEKTIDEFATRMQSGEYTAHRLTELYLARIEATNRKGPALHAVIETDPDALSVAAALD